VPALAAGWRVPDPVHDWARYLPYAVLTEIMSGGAASRLERRLVQDDRIASQQLAYLGLLGNPFDVRDPTVLVVQVRHSPGIPANTVLAAIDEEFRRLASDGLTSSRLQGIQMRISTRMLYETGSILNRMQALGAFEQQHGRAELLADLPELLCGVTVSQIQEAAGRLTASRRGVVELAAAKEPSASGAKEWDR
jgi:predicted Zn-dependent peptidase